MYADSDNYDGDDYGDDDNDGDGFDVDNNNNKIRRWRRYGWDW